MIRLKNISYSLTKVDERTKWWWEIDPWLFWSVVILLLFGVVMVLSSSMTTGLYAYGDAFYFFRRHLKGVVLGIVVGIVTTFLPLSRLKRWSKFFLLLVLILLVMVFVPGVGRQGAGVYRWIRLGVFNFQPSELAKLAVVLYMADALTSYQDRVEDFWRGVVPFFIVVGIICLLILMEPNLGTAVFLLLLTFVMLFLGGGKIKHLLLVWAVLAPIGVFLVVVWGKEYWMDRFMAFLDPWKDPQGRGFHVIQSLIALGSGGIWGRGLGESRQKFFFLPDRHTDFIYAIVGEELGFLGTFFLVVLLGIILWRGWRIAIGAQDEFRCLLSMGIVAMIILQAFVNMGAVLRLLPITGITFPFLSYGNSSLLILCAAVGILFNIARHREGEEER
ncbi:MAG: putative lipid II flippase FtsW [Candidatus Caldatribacteriaceae bacterium]